MALSLQRSFLSRENHFRFNISMRYIRCVYTIAFVSVVGYTPFMAKAKPLWQLCVQELAFWLETLSNHRHFRRRRSTDTPLDAANILILIFSLHFLQCGCNVYYLFLWRTIFCFASVFFFDSLRILLHFLCCILSKRLFRHPILMMIFFAFFSWFLFIFFFLHFSRELTISSTNNAHNNIFSLSQLFCSLQLCMCFQQLFSNVYWVLLLLYKQTRPRESHGQKKGRNENGNIKRIYEWRIAKKRIVNFFFQTIFYGWFYEYNFFLP